jgi:hypothetical protein
VLFLELVGNAFIGARASFWRFLWGRTASKGPS